MSFFRRNHLVAWLTLAAMALAMLAPGVSRALVFAQGEVMPWGEICSASSDMRGADESSPARPVAHVLDACAYCALAGDTPALPPAANAVMVELPAVGRALPPLFLHAPRTLFAWHAAQPRAPPTSS